MKQLKQRGKEKAWKWTAAGSIAAVFLLSVGMGIWLNADNQKETVLEENQNAVLQAETEAVVSEKKQARTTLNKPAPAAKPGDDREVFKIIEVIPHEACSVFPYFVDWKTEEGYDENTPLGYDGILVSAQFTGGASNSGLNLFAEENVPAKESRPFSYVKEKYIKEYFDTLEEYAVEFVGEYDLNRGGSWFRKTKDENNLKEELYGYFEYVGEGKGLYYINTSLIAGETYKADNTFNNEGIHYEIQAVPRKGTEPQGYLYVADSAYFWAKDSAGSAKPDYNGKEIKGLTGYNYDLSFALSEEGEYKIDTSTYSLTGGDEYEYEIKIEGTTVTDWKSGFYYQEKGDYEVVSFSESESGKYVRYESTEMTDGLETENPELPSGYFLLDPQNQYKGIKRYNVTFQEMEGKGNYMPNMPDKLENLKYHFVYKGKNKGHYNLSFLYAPEAPAQERYQVTVESVLNEKGRYALTSTSTSGNGEPIYSKEKLMGAVYDYAEVITYIDSYAGAAHGEPIDGKYARKGVTSGRVWGEGNREAGGWVFVPVEKEEDMEQTFLKNIRNNSDGQNSNTSAFCSLGERIYVSGQKRVYRYYCRDGLRNNEWFKLLCYANNPKDSEQPYSELIDGVGYDFEKTALDNLNNEVTKQILSAFDSQFRIEIVQITPEKLTSEDIKSADLIYISNQEGTNGMSKNWNEVSKKLRDEELVECNWDTVCPFEEGQDISSDALMTLYDECIYERNRALIVCHSVIQDDASLSRNMTKLYYMMNYFDEALNWAYFMPDMYPDVAKEEYSKIRRLNDKETSVDVYKGGENNVYNSEFNEEEAERDIVSWKVEYFQVWSTWSHSTPIFPFQDDIAHWANKVREEETKLTVAYYIDPIFMNPLTKSNIWKILKNRKLDNSMVVVEVTNGEVTSETIPRRIIYADEFDSKSFDIKYKVLLLGSEKNPSSLQDVTLTFEDGTQAGKAAILQYNEENTNNVRHGFTVDGSGSGILNPSVTEKKVTITATNSNGKTGTVDVYVILREAFLLN